MPPDWPLYLGTYFLLSLNFACAKCCSQCVNQAQRGAPAGACCLQACRPLASPDPQAHHLGNPQPPPPPVFPLRVSLLPRPRTSRPYGHRLPWGPASVVLLDKLPCLWMCHTQSHLHGPAAPERFLQTSQFRVIRPTAMASYRASSLSSLLLRCLFGSSPL